MAPLGAAFCAGSAPNCVYPNTIHVGEVNYQATIGYTGTGKAVPTTPNGHQHLVVPGKVDSPYDIGCALAAGD